MIRVSTLCELIPQGISGLGYGNICDGTKGDLMHGGAHEIDLAACGYDVRES